MNTHTHSLRHTHTLSHTHSHSHTHTHTHTLTHTHSHTHSHTHTLSLTHSHTHTHTHTHTHSHTHTHPTLRSHLTPTSMAITKTEPGRCQALAGGGNHVRLFATPWTAALQAPLSMGSSKEEYCSGLAISSSRGSSRPRDRTRVSCVSCIGRQVPYHSTTWEAHRTMRFPGMGLMTHRTRGSTLGSVTPIRAESRVSRRRPHTPALTADRVRPTCQSAGAWVKEMRSLHMAGY